MGKRISVKWDHEFSCYDVEVLDPQATVGEFERECAALFDGEQVFRKYSDSCIGCSLCCSERIPVTKIDLIRIVAEDGDPRSVLEEELKRAAEELVNTTRIGECIDVAMKIDEVGICRFWVKERGICAIYRLRPFACRTYICAPVSRRFEELRTVIINQGQDDLVSFLFSGEEIAEVYRCKNAFAGALDYDQVRIGDICTKRLWRMLFAAR